MWTRKSTDPLGHLLFERYGLHVLNRPRQDVEVFHLFPVADGRAHPPGRLASFLGTPIDLPAVKAGERLIDVSGTTSDAVSGEAGFSFLEGFLALVGAQPLVNAFTGAFKKTRTRSLRFRFGGATRNHVDDPFELELTLRRHAFHPEDSLMKEGYAYYLATAVHWSDELSFVAVDDRDTAVDLASEVKGVADAKVAVSAGADREITAKSDVPLVYGVELSRLQYNAKRKRLELDLAKGYVQVLGAAPRELPGSARAMIGEPEDSMLLEVMPEDPGTA